MSKYKYCKGKEHLAFKISFDLKKLTQVTFLFCVEEDDLFVGRENTQYLVP